MKYGALTEQIFQIIKHLILKDSDVYSLELITSQSTLGV